MQSKIFKSAIGSHFMIVGSCSTATIALTNLKLMFTEYVHISITCLFLKGLG